MQAAIAINHAVNGIMSLVANSQIKDKYTEEEAKEEIEKITGKETVDIKDSYVEILNSVNIKSRFQRIKISKIIKNTVNEEGNKLTKRTTYGLASEWLGHNLFNRIHDDVTTQNVNLDYEFKENAWYTKAGTIALMIFGCL